MDQNTLADFLATCNEKSSSLRRKSELVCSPLVKASLCYSLKQRQSSCDRDSSSRQSTAATFETLLTHHHFPTKLTLIVPQLEVKIKNLEPRPLDTINPSLKRPIPWVIVKKATTKPGSYARIKPTKTLKIFTPQFFNSEDIQTQPSASQTPKSSNETSNDYKVIKNIPIAISESPKPTQQTPYCPQSPPLVSGFLTFSQQHQCTMQQTQTNHSRSTSKMSEECNMLVNARALKLRALQTSQRATLVSQQNSNKYFSSFSRTNLEPKIRTQQLRRSIKPTETKTPYIISFQTDPLLAHKKVEPPTVTATSSLVYEIDMNGNNMPASSSKVRLKQTHFSSNSRSSCQIASLTKIMTCIVALDMCEQYRLDPQQLSLQVGRFESNIKGTSAEIRAGDIYTLEQLLYGLMLPSGNDASLAIAVCCGKHMLTADHQQRIKATQKAAEQSSMGWSVSPVRRLLNPTRLQPAEALTFTKYKCYRRFICEMNKKAKYVGLQKTNYNNSHGLSDPLNKSCCYDICILCEYAMKKPSFRKIVCTKTYSCLIENTLQSTVPQPAGPVKPTEEEEEEESFEDDANGFQEQSQSALQIANNIATAQPNDANLASNREVTWTNTHKLLHDKKMYFGVKTGYTRTAGSCLASCVEDTKTKRQFIIVVLGCRNTSQRFKDTQLLRRWLWTKQRFGKILKPISQMEIYPQ